MYLLAELVAHRQLIRSGTCALLLLFAALGCSSSDQQQIDAAVSATLSAAKPTPTSRPDLLISIIGIGTTQSHSQLGLFGSTEDSIRLVVRVIDGDHRTELLMPIAEAPPYSVEPAANNPISTTPILITPTSGNIVFQVIGYQQDDVGELDLLLSLVMGESMDFVDLVRGSGAVNSEVAATYIGSYQAVWSQANQWGSGDYVAVGDDDLRLWFRVEVDGRASQKIVGRPFPTATPAPTTTPISDLIGSWQLVSSSQLMSNDQVIHFHNDGSITLETVSIFWNIEESGTYSRAPNGGVRIKVFNDFGFAYIDNNYEVTIVGDKLRLTALGGPGYDQEWIRVE